MSDHINLSAHHSLYELDTAYMEALRNMEIDENGEVLGGEHLALIQEARDQKLQNLACMYLIWECEIDAVEKEKKRVEAIRKSLQSKMDWAKHEILQRVTPGAKIGRISWRKSKALVIEADAINNIPAEYVIQVLTPCKTLIQAALERKEVIPGCTIVERQNIQIK